MPLENFELVGKQKNDSESSDEDMVQIEVDSNQDGQDDGVQEDLRLAKEGEAMLQQIKSETGRIGYDSADFVT